MPRPSKRWKDATARAHRGKSKRVDEDTDSDDQCTRWTGGINHVNSSDSEEDLDFELSDMVTDSLDEDEDFGELEDEELLASLQLQGAQEAEKLKRITAYEKLQRDISECEWKKAESNRALGYNGNSARTKRRSEKAARDKSEADAKTRTT